MNEPVLITAAVSGPVDTEPLWRAHAAGADGRREVDRLTRALPERIAEIAGAALENGPDPERTGCVVGSAYGSGHVAETIRARLDADARSSLAPESFIYFNAHGITSLLCLRHRLRGFSTTILGAEAGMQALAVALRRLRMDPSRPLLCGGYEMLSPAAAAALHTDRTPGSVAFLVLESAYEARARGASVLATIDSVRTEPARVGLGADVGVSAPIAAIAAALRDRTPVADPFTAVAHGARHSYRCTVGAAA
ncbi:3-oxoacyl-ACP synthase [Nocardia bovistercoris]|uniref:3-oxoacyl-ACP synthase n=1 Tax=Nocardia bovistercoris TaxID=2785916 RepID=A0A931N6E0_9NOCA|nr:3-oxoacyl-ACP synthase [Nocardia bovistercoris]MBH0780859.1 hypothetical protein [Nocardia bovistercoris]